MEDPRGVYFVDSSRTRGKGSLPFAKAREVEVVLKYASLHFVDG